MPYQPVEVIANGTKLADWKVGKRDDFTVTVPVELLSKKRVLKLELRMPRAASPSALGISADSRVLGICCFEVQMTKAVLPTDIWPHAAAESPPS